MGMGEVRASQSARRSATVMVPNGNMKRAVCTSALLGIVVLLSSVTLAATRPPEPQIDFQFDRQAFIAGEPFQLQVAITTEGQGEPQITLPSFDGLRVLRNNVSSPASGYSFSMSFGTGQNAQQVIRNSGTTRYDIVLMASSPGKLTIGPVKVVLDGFTFKGRSYPIEVFDRGSSSAATPAAPQANGMVEAEGLTDSQLEGARIDPDYFLHMIPSRTECSVGEQIVLDVYLFTSVSNIRADQFEKEPGTEGFWVERFEDFDLRNHRNQQVVINGVLYEQALLKKLALFPLKSGKLTIAPPVFSFVVGGGGFFSFSRGKQVKRAASPITIEVLPLPETGRPAAFSDANVGQFTFLVDASATEVKVGEPVTVTVNVRGNGNIRGVELPSFGEVSGFKTYAPETDVEVQARGGAVSGMSQSRTLFIPERDGHLTIPALTFSYFDLAAKSYRTRTSEPIEVTVAKGRNADVASAVGSTKVDGSQPVQVDAPMERMNAQMRTILNGVDVTKASPPLFSQGWYLGLVGGVPVLFALYLLVMGIRKRAEENVNKGRSRRAEAEARKALAGLARETTLSNDRFFSRLHKILLVFLEARLEEVVTGDTMNQLSQRLSVRGIAEGLTREVIGALEEYEFARFAKSDGGNAERKGDLQRAEDLISRLGNISLLPLPGEKGDKS